MTLSDHDRVVVSAFLVQQYGTFEKFCLAKGLEDGSPDRIINELDDCGELELDDTSDPYAELKEGL